MIGKKINQLATELAPVSTDLTIIGDPISGVSKKITLAQLGAIFSGAVSFYNDFASFPATGDINVIYCAKDTKKLYLWSGSAYVEVFPSQALLDTYQLRSEKGNANGYASLDSSGKVPISQLPSSIMEYKGTWSASTNTPTLANGTGDTGDVYICNSPGSVNFGAGAITFAVGDYVIYSGSIWQRSSGAVGTVTSVAASITGDAIGITGSPVTTSGTLALAFAGTSSQYINGAGNLTTFPTLTGYVPYTGATANVDLGTYDLTADFITASRGSYTSSGGGNTLEISHSSGSGIALNITKGGSGEGLYINKTSGSGNAATIVGTLEATTLVKTGGTSSQFLKADGSVDSSTYVTTDTFQNISASKTFAVGFNIASAGGTNQITNFANTNSLFSGSGGSNVFGFNSANNIYFGKGLDNGGVLSWNNSAVRYYTLPDATGTIALVGGTGVGTVTSVGLSAPTGFSVSGSPVTSSGTLALSFASGYSLPTDTKQSNWDTAYNSRIVSVVAPLTFSLNTLGITQATGSSNGYLSSADWTTFNNKQSALTNPVTGTGTTNYLPKFTGTSTIGNSLVYDNGTNVGIGTTSPSYKLDITALGYGIQHYGDANNSLRTYCGGGYQIIESTNSGTNNQFGYRSGFFYIETGAAEKIRLNASGNLSIGNTNDTYKLDVSGTGRFSGALTGNSSLSIGGVITSGGLIKSVGNGASFQLKSIDNNGGYIEFSPNTGGSYGYIGSAYHLLASPYNIPTNLAIRAEADLILTTGGYTPRLTIASTGAATFSSSVTATQFIVGTATTSSDVSVRYKTDTGDFSTINDRGSHAFGIYDHQVSSYRMYINTSGNVGIGTTSPAQKLDVNGSIRLNSLIPASGNTLNIAANSTNYQILSYPFTGLIVVRDNTTGGSGLYLLDPNLGVNAYSNTLPYTLTFTYGSGVWNVQKNTGSSANISFNLIAGV